MSLSLSITAKSCNYYVMLIFSPRELTRGAFSTEEHNGTVFHRAFSQAATSFDMSHFKEDKHLKLILHNLLSIPIPFGQTGFKQKVQVNLKIICGKAEAEIILAQLIS